MAGPLVGKTFQIGDCLGKGAFGCVYAALNMKTGEVVAVKQIRTANILKSDMTLIMSEIDLLKELNVRITSLWDPWGLSVAHANIVKYLGFSKTQTSLNIIMEYCENGSLSSICKKFGKFPESLVAVYTGQVLDGLVYLHEQGVIHRDIKGANILTTKDGQVKLADFGIASKVNASSKAVAGSPYWMAPEVIELSGATTSSDVWSLGCTVIELLEGKPPYHDLAAMSALFRIVHDEYPPIPDQSSAVVRHFLVECFQKDPNLRISASRLLHHPWIAAAREVPKKRERAATYSNASAPKPKQAVHKGHRSTAALRTALGGSERVVLSDLRKANLESAAHSKFSVASNPKAGVVIEPDSDNENWDNDFAEDRNGDSATLMAHTMSRNTQWLSPPSPSRAGPQASASKSMALLDPRFVEADGNENYSNIYDIPDGRSPIAADMVRSTFEDVLQLQEFDDDDDPFDGMVLQDFDRNASSNEELLHMSDIYEPFITQIKRETDEKVLALSSEAVITNLKAFPANGKLLVTHHGIVPIMRLLRSTKDERLAKRLLEVLNKAIVGAPEIRHTICMLGGLPTILSYMNAKHNDHLRERVVTFIGGIVADDPGLAKVFLSCGAVSTFIGMLNEDYDRHKNVVLCAVDAISCVFTAQTSASRSDLCLLFVHHGLLHPLAHVWRAAVYDRAPDVDSYVRKMAAVLLTLSQADTSIKDSLAQGSCVRTMVAELRHVEPETMLVMLKCLKNVSMSGEALQHLSNAGLIRAICEILSNQGMPHFIDMQNQAVNILYNLCRLNRERQAAAVSAGCIPHLQKFIESNSPLRQFALPLLCDLVNVGGRCWKFLRTHRVLASYLTLLKDAAWQVSAIEAISIWISEDGEEIQFELATRSSDLSHAFCTSTGSNFDSLLLPFQRIVVASSVVTSRLAGTVAFIEKIATKLVHPSAGVRLSLLLILYQLQLASHRQLLQHTGGDDVEEQRRTRNRSQPHGMKGQSGGGDEVVVVTGPATRFVRRLVEKLCQEDPAVLVREQARKCVEVYKDVSSSSSS
ncbi:hypothetical protein HKX48_004168 [Thoreauomyces humboldtii]|nr:hypothetical protein HKX48_004168 [Thoreauomyces humboldtii]